MTYTISVDTGGTFTDLVLSDESRVLQLIKSPTTPNDVFGGVSGALEGAARSQGTNVEALLAETETFVYSTTSSTNAIIQGRTARTAFLTTAGHRDILVYREGGKLQPHNIAMPYPDPYVPRSLTFEIHERVLADGSIALPLDEADLASTLSRLGELEVEAIGVCLLWSIVNPEHELRVGGLISETLPGVEFTLSHEINPIVREYRRASSAVIDASIKPLMRTHLEHIDARLRGLGFKGEPLMVTHASGGVLSLEDMCARPLHTVDSGPALAPVAGMRYTVEEPDLRFPNTLVVDTGGTSFDVSQSRGERVLYTREKWLGPMWQGHMTGLPAVDTKSIGAGGGSIGYVDDAGLLHVGPESAGADPGPACYGRGGERPTVTDAAVVLGYINPEFFLGGEIALKPEFAFEAIKEYVAGPLGFAPEQGAEAMMAVNSEMMRGFVSNLTITQGLDPRECVIVAGGGAAGLNILAIARELGVRQVLAPKFAAGLSATGGQFSDIMATISRTAFTNTRDFQFESVNRACQEITDDLTAFDLGGEAQIEYICEARYADQIWELDVHLGDRSQFGDEEDVAHLKHRFDELHKEVFAVNQPGEDVEILTWRGEARLARNKPALGVPARREKDGDAVAERRIFMDGDFRDVPIYRGSELEPGEVLHGPLILEEDTTTIVAIPGSKTIVRPTHYLFEIEE
jgi:N-methylhydantoinase A